MNRDLINSVTNAFIGVALIVDNLPEIIKHTGIIRKEHKDWANRTLTFCKLYDKMIWQSQEEEEQYMKTIQNQRELIREVSTLSPAEILMVIDSIKEYKKGERI